MSEPKKQPPFTVLGGCPRSGTTALLFLLNSDPRVFISAEENLVRCTTGLTKVLGTRQRLAAKAAGRQRDMSVRERWPEGGVDPFHFTAEMVPEVLWDVYRRHHSQVHPGTELRIWGDKFPRYHEDLADLRSAPVPVRFIHITRNPYDVVDSMLRRTQKAQQGRDWWRAITEPDRMILAWNDALTTAIQLDADPEVDLLHIQYEDLVFEPGRTCAVLGDFLGLELQVDYPLVDDPTQHFSREHLTPEIREQIARAADLPAYRRQLTETGTGAISLQHLPDA